MRCFAVCKFNSSTNSVLATLVQLSPFIIKLHTLFLKMTSRMQYVIPIIFQIIEHDMHIQCSSHHKYLSLNRILNIKHHQHPSRVVSSPIHPPYQSLPYY